MRIAQIAPLFESIPPKLYGGTGRVVSYLTEALIDLGHHVTLFASGDSLTRAELISSCAKALQPGVDRALVDAAHAALLATVYERRHDFDVLHFHLGDWHLREPRLLESAHVATVHESLDLAEHRTPYGAPELRLIARSDAQRRASPDLNWLGTVYHGLPEGLYRPRYEHGSYLTFIGRIARNTHVERAVEIARRFGMPLKIAAQIAPCDEAYGRPARRLLREPALEFLGEVNEAQKAELLAGAYALLFPSESAEPFGLPLIEALACGTPVVAWRSGAAPELIDPWVTGFTVDSVEDALRALAHVARLDRRLVARIAHQRFGACRMARDYLRLYARGIARDLTVPTVIGGSTRTSAGVGANARPGE